MPRRVITVSDAAPAKPCQAGRVVLVEDDPDVRHALKELLEGEGYSCDSFVNANDYLHYLTVSPPSSSGPGCILCDVRMPGIDGLELLETLDPQRHHPIILMSGASGAREVARGFRGGVIDFLVKPFEDDELFRAVRSALAKDENRAARVRQGASLQRLLSTLTPREKETALRLARGVSIGAIAADLSISLRTAKFHRQNAGEKLGAITTNDFRKLLGDLAKGLPDAEPGTPQKPR